VKSWEIIADSLSKIRWSWGCVSTIDSNGRTIWIADAQESVLLFVRMKVEHFLEVDSLIRQACGKLLAISTELEKISRLQNSHRV
jgi:hypothetical protein